MKLPLIPLLLLAGSLHAAPVLSLDDKKILIEDGAFRCTLDLPVPIDGAKKKGKVAESTVSDRSVVIKFTEGGQLGLQLAEGEIILNTAELAGDVAQLYLSGNVPTTGNTGGGWRFDSQTGVLPEESTPGQIHQGNYREFAVSAPGGQGVSLTLPAKVFQQLMDLRPFQTRSFFWQAWLPVSAGGGEPRLKVGEGTATPGTAAAATPAPAAAPAPKPAPKPAPSRADRQGWGQLMKWDEKASGTRILKWPDGRKAAFLLGFDDNGASHITTVIPELEKRKMVGAFYVNPGTPKWKEYLPQWQEAAKSPYVVLCNHTFTHLGTTGPEAFEADLVKTSDAIYALTPHLKNPRVLAFRTPGGVPWKLSKEQAKPILAKYKMFDRPFLDGPTLTMKSQEDTLAPIALALAEGNTGFVDFHGVGADGHATPVEWFTALLDKLEEHRADFWITDPVSWYQYQLERNKSKLEVLQKDEKQVRLSLTNDLDPAYFDHPLTVAVEVPAAWEKCAVTQGGKTVEVTAKAGEARIQAVPGAGEIIIAPR
jgi:hypothetical protein